MDILASIIPLAAQISEGASSNSGWISRIKSSWHYENHKFLPFLGKKYAKLFNNSKKE